MSENIQIHQLPAAGRNLLNTDKIAIDDASGISKHLTGEEINANFLGIQEVLIVSTPGQTDFTLSGTPIGNAALAFYWNGQLRERGVAYIQVGTSLTWLDPDGYTLQTTDKLIAIYNVANGGDGIKEVFLACTDYNGSLGNYRVRSIAGTGSHRFTFPGIPDDFNSLISINLVGIVSAGAAGSGKDIDIFSDYAADDEVYNNHTESDTTSTYDFTGKTNTKIDVIDLSGILVNLSAGDSFGIFVDHKAIGGTIYYLGIRLKYL